VQVNNQPLKIEKAYFATNSFFNVFTYPLIAGNKNTAIKEPFTAALSETTAKRIFGTTNVIGKPLQVNRSDNYTITAVYKDAPVNTQLKPDMLLSYATFVKWTTDSSGNGTGNCLAMGWLSHVFIVTQKCRSRSCRKEVRTGRREIYSGGHEKIQRRCCIPPATFKGYSFVFTLHGGTGPKW
jgi:hypothetical protein